VGLTYLVARLADTISDAGNWPAPLRLAYLERWENSLFQKEAEEWKVEDSVGGFSARESELLLSGGQILEAFRQAPEGDRMIARELLETLFQGMRQFIQVFSEASEQKVIFGISSSQAFDWYCYQHAGCVDLFWGKIFGLPQGLENLAVSYGKGLERVNVLRDAIEDRSRGVILFPSEELKEAGLHSTEPWKEPGWAEYRSRYIAETIPLLLHGAQFCDSISYGNFRLRFASMLPAKIALATLKKIQSLGAAAAAPAKISRREVRALVRESIYDVLFHRSLSRRF